MIALLSPSKAQEKLAQNMRKRRKAMGLTQKALSNQSGVSLGSLRKFEQTGKISLESLLKLIAITGDLQAVINATKPAPQAFKSIDDVVKQSKTSRSGTAEGQRA